MRYAFLFALLLVTFPVVSQAATLYMDPPTADLSRGDSVTVNVRLDTDEAAGECVNAVNGIITYSDNVILADASIGQSIFPLWVEPPKIDKEHHRITFMGGIPNGYCGRVQGDPRLTNTILQLVFRAPGVQVGSKNTSHEAEVVFAPETSMTLNNGLGTAAQVATLGAKFTLSDTVGNEIRDDWKTVIDTDKTPPEDFSISLEKDEHAFDKKYYIVFNTTDKQSGISHYEVIEETQKETSLFNFGAATAPWREVRSPYILADQGLHSTIRVRAVDKAGNEYIATLAPQNPQNSKTTLYIEIAAGVASLTFGVGLIAWFIIRRKRKKVSHPEVAIHQSDEII